jgi:lysophospholipase L1-like esterase
MVKILVFGDSIAWGAFDLEKGGWVERLKTYFFNRELGKEFYSVYNLEISRDNTDKLMKRFEVETIAREPSIIIFAIGINDSQYILSRYNPRVSLEKFRENYSNLINLSRKFTDKIIFIGLTNVDETKSMPIPWDTSKFYDNENILEYDKEIRRICNENNLFYIPVSDLLTKEDLSDGLHPNTEGHRKIFERIKEELIKILN